MNLKQILLLLALTCCWSLAQSQVVQCGPTVTGCSQAINIYDYFLEFNNPPAIAPPDAFPGCPSNTIDNPYWFKFVPLTSSIDMWLAGGHCLVGGGIQAAIYDACDSFTPINGGVRCDCSLAISFNLRQLEIGRTYFLLVDGCAGDICEVDLEIFSGQIMIPSAPNFDLPAPMGDTLVCGYTITDYTLPPDTIGYSYTQQWHLEPASGGSQGVLLNTTCEFVDINWIPTPIRVDTGYYFLSYSRFYDNLNLQVFSDTLRIRFDQNLEVRNARYCPVVPPFGYILPENGFFFTEGTYHEILYDPTVDSCSRLLELHVTADQVRSSFIFDSVCLDQCVTYGGQTFCIPGSYQVNIFDSTGVVCDSVIYLELLDRLADTEVNLSSTPPACVVGGPDGTAEATVTGSVGPYDILWSTGETTSQINGLDRGWYYVTVTANNDCYRVDSIFVGGPFAVIATNTRPNCSNQGGTVTAMVNGNISSPVFTWSNGGQGATQTGLSSGTYTVTLTDQLSGCTATASVDVPTGFNSNGSVTGFYDPVTEPQGYFYAPEGNFYLAGIYDVILSQVNQFGCDSIVQLVVTENPANVPVTCFSVNRCEEAITLCDVSTSFRNPNLARVPTIFPGCPSNVLDNEIWFSFIPETDFLTISITSANCQVGGGIQAAVYEDCLDFNSPVVSPQCGCATGPITFALTGLNIGQEYYLMIDGCAGDVCDVDISFVEGQIVDQNSPSYIPYFNQPFGNLLIGCPGEVGTYDFDPIPRAFAYEWILPSGYQYLGGDCSRSRIRLGDNSGALQVRALIAVCGDTMEVISDPLEIIIDAVTERDTGSYCPVTSPQGYFYPRDGNFYPAGTYRISFSSIGAQECDTVVNLVVTTGNNNFTFDVVKCDSSCFTFGSLEVCENVSDRLYVLGQGTSSCDSTVLLSLRYEDLNSNVELILRDPLCLEPGTGEIDVDLFDVSLPVTYLWGNGATTERLTNLSSGTYTLTLTSAAGCTYIDSATINGFDYELVATDIDACDTTQTFGSAAIILSSNFVNPVFEWSNGATTPSINNLPAGVYTVTVIDNDLDNCFIIDSVQVQSDSSCFVAISGVVYNDDVNQACVVDNSVFGIPGLVVQLEDGTSTLTDQNGQYSFFVPAGNRQISLNFNPQLYVPVCADPINLSASDPALDYPGNHFFLRLQENKDLAVGLLKNDFWPGAVMLTTLTITNFGNQTEDGTASLQLDPNLIFVDAIPMETQYSAVTRTLTWDFTALAPGETRRFNVYLRTPTTTPIGTPLSFNAQVGPFDNDIDLSNNTLACNAQVLPPYDPNLKTVDPSGQSSEGFISRQENLLSYQIQFQNTGQGVANRVVVLDTLDQDFAIGSFVAGAASHPYTVALLNSRVLEFTFDDINLPPANTDFAGSIGQLAFQIRYKDGLPFRTQLTNDASVYFDQEPPIKTNTTVNTIIDPTVVTSALVEICAGESFRGTTYFQDAMISETFPQPFYDSIVNTTIRVFPADPTEETLALCSGGSFRGQAIFNDTIFVEQLVNPAGCTYTHTTTITVFPTTQTSRLESLCSGDTYEGRLYLRDTIISETYTNIAGCDSLVEVIIEVHPTFNGVTELSLCLGESYDGVVYLRDTMITESNLTINGCDSTVMINIQINEPYQTSELVRICAGESYRGEVYNSSTTLVETYLAANGCDSTVTTQLEVIQPVSSQETVTLCNGTTYRGQVFRQDTVLTDQLQSLAGCDSIHTTTIRVQPVYDISKVETLCAGDTYNGIVYTMDTMIVEQWLTRMGCDSVIRVDLQVLQPVVTSEHLSLCAGSIFRGQTIASDTTFSEQLQTTQGCDSTHLITVEVLPNRVGSQIIRLCAGEAYQGQIYSRDTTLEAQLLGSNGCDSTLITQLQIVLPTTTINELQLCEGDVYRGIALSGDTIFTDNLRSQLGCDSTVITEVSVVDLLVTDIPVQLCPGVAYQGTLYQRDTILETNFTSSNGCDSLVRTQIQLLPEPLGNQAVRLCPGEQFNGLTILRDTIVETQLVATNGCDSLLLTTIEVAPEYLEEETVWVCPESTFRGVLVTQDTSWVENLQSSEGCDSILNFTVNIFQESFTTNQVTLCSGESYQGQIYTDQATLTEIFSDQNGCDSTVQTQIEVWPVYDQTSDLELCRGDEFRGQRIFNDTTVIENLTSVQGCDSLVTFNIRVRNEINRTFTVSLCYGEAYNGVNYFVNDTLSDSFTSANGCDSLVKTFILVKPAYELSLSDTICAGDLYDGQVITEDTLLEYQLQSIDNCDSLVQINLEVLPIYQSIEYISVCPGETYQGQVITQDTTWTEMALSSEGCDSSMQFIVEVQPNYDIGVDTTLRPGELYRGQAIEMDTVIIDSLLAADGCDSIVTTTISVMTTSTTDLTSTNGFYLFPNPTLGQLNVNWDYPLGQDLAVRLYGVDGRLVLDRLIPRVGKEAIIDLSGLPAGTYLLRLNTDQEQWIERVIRL